MKQLKTKLAILGLIMVFSVPVLWNIGLRLITLSSQFYFYSFFAGMILGLVGIILISLSYSWILAAGAAFLAFGINRIMAGVHYSSFYFNDPISSYYISHYISVGYVFICIGILLIILTLFIRGKK
ncbi:MAG: hypothetical protein KAT65_17060 [Methanophagales archaeon]|nr:hypothetical protein [Methanophagales archaeon]